jgi:enamine deaminase RidA (YjgF/YER057c/UK114 family)
MAISKEAKSLGMSWEKEYGYSQAVKVDNTIYVSGQVSHDDKGHHQKLLYIKLVQGIARVFVRQLFKTNVI